MQRRHSAVPDHSRRVRNYSETFMVVQYLNAKHPGLESAADTKPELSRHYTATTTINYFMVKTVKGINMVLSINAPTSHTTQPKLIMQLRWDVFLCLNLSLICSWHCELDIWQHNYCIWFQWETQPLSPLYALTHSSPERQYYHISCCCSCETC